MKTNRAALIFLILAGIAFSGCVSSPVQIDPSMDGFTPGERPESSVHEYDSDNFNPQYNPDGSLTVFKTKNIRFTIMPMTHSKGTRGALDRTTTEFDALIEQYLAVLEENPKDFDACIMLAGLYIDRAGFGDADLAVKYSDMALEINKNDTDALYARALAYNEKGDAASRAKALADLEVVLRANIQSMKGVYYVMGMIYYKDSKIDKSIEAFEKVKALDPDFVDTNEILEVLYRSKK